MIQLYINGKLCDIDDDVKIHLEKDFDNKSEHIIEEASYSYEIDLPITDGNREAFGFTDVFDVGAKFNQSYDAVLNVDETNILKGKFVMDDISNDTYSGNLYVPKKKSLKNVLGDKKMKDIKAHNYDISSWRRIKEIQDGVIFNRDGADNHIIFPYILYRLPYNNSESRYNITTQDLAASGNTFTTENIFPAFNVLSVLKDIFEGEGYNIQGNIFELKKFKDLYQTFSYDPKKYHEDKVVPYYLSFNCDYVLRNSDNISSTATIASLYNDPSMDFGTDAPLLSENSTINEISDDYNMMTKAYNSNSRVISIPKSGWYQIYCSGSIDFPTANGHWSQDGRNINVCGCYNDADRVDFSQNIAEFQIKKTSTPLSDPKIYSYCMSTPVNATDMSKENVLYTDRLMDWLPIGGWFSTKLDYNEARNRFPKNQRQALIRDDDVIGTDEFIAGARFGSHFCSFDSDRTPDRNATEMVLTCLPDPLKARMKKKVDDAGVETMWMPMYTDLGIRGSDSDDYRKDYGSKTAVVMLKDDSYSNFEGWNIFKPEGGTEGTWNTDANGRRSYVGQSTSAAQCTPMLDGSVNRRGGFMIATCVWLEEGENISFELMFPYNDYRDECGWLETCDWKHRGNSGLVNIHAGFTFNIGLASNNKDFVPTTETPIPDVLNWDERQERSITNVNKFLGEGKVNDWIENLLNTFNLKLTKIGDKTYSIDTMTLENDMYGNVINVDEWANVMDAEFHRLDAKNTTLEWSISTDEEGYVHGNDTREVKTKRDESGYTGGITFAVESSNTEEKIKSNYSYTWLKDIAFVNGDSIFPSGVREVPIIGDADLWLNDYMTIQDQDYATDKTSRLIYIDRDPNSQVVNYFNVVGYRNDTQIPEIKTPLIFAKNYTVYDSQLGQRKIFRLDYDNSESTKSDETITDVFFNIKKGTQYEVDVPVALPNDIYAKIKANTLVKFNDCLFRVLGIEGHNIDMSDKATLKLITLN